MKILYIDGAPKDSLAEDYSINPKRYGGGGCIARFLKLRMPGFVIAAKKEGFENYTDADRPRGLESAKNEWIIPESVYSRLQSMEPAKDIFRSLGFDITGFDLIVSHNRGMNVNCEGLKAKYVSWATGGFEDVVPTVDYLLTYNDHQHPKVSNPKTKIGRIVIGKTIPNFEPAERENYIFQCTAIKDCFSVQEVVNFCESHKISGYFAGPDSDGKVLFNRYAKYIGEISEEEKLYYLKRSRLTTLLHKAHTCFSLSAVEALSVGTPVACYNKLFWPEMIADNYNGFFIDPQNFDASLLSAYEKAKNIDTFGVYLSSFRYSEEQMCVSFMYNFHAILQDINKNLQSPSICVK